MESLLRKSPEVAPDHYDAYYQYVDATLSQGSKRFCWKEQESSETMEAYLKSNKRSLLASVEVLALEKLARFYVSNECPNN